MRTTMRTLRGRLAYLREVTGDDQYTIRRAYGRPRLDWIHPETTGIRDISPRLSSGALYQWMGAFIAGFLTGKERAHG